jgi:phenylalanyl-tRNA synthetase alpha chain
MIDIRTLKAELCAQAQNAGDLQALEEVRVSALGKKGRITELMKTLGGMDPNERKTKGQEFNALRDEIAAALKAREDVLREQDMEKRLRTEVIDVTLSPRPQRKGHVHPISQTMEELVNIFAGLGFEVAEGPDIEDDWHNFTALNFPPNHPARAMQDTFFLPDDPQESGERAKKLLRTHTSPVQIRHMRANEPPFKIVCMGRTYRSDHDMTHSPMFHQIEGLMIGEDTHMGHLKGCLMDFTRSFFGVEDLPLRMRPSFFPFVEPGAEVDIGYIREGEGIRLGRAQKPEDQKWMEILGCGMVHPNVLKNCDIDPGRWQGFAFGCGIERITMLKYGIPDLRTFFESDVRWLSHYGFDPLNRPNSATRP